MNRKDFKIDRKKANTQDLRKKEKENRKLQLELNQEREKFNQMVVKHQKELNEMQAVRFACICSTFGIIFLNG
jgi:Rho-associated protein kinase 1